MNALHIAPKLDLPLDAVTKTFAIIAQRRKGKTYTANVMAEEMVAAGIPWVALDPTGAWWGLRSSASGKTAGLPVYVFGGDHGDLPLERTAGKMIADLVVEHPGWYILDFSHFESKEAERQLATDFAERFYRRKGTNKSPMHLFVDEADMFAPQRIPSGDQRMLGAFESIVRRGGIRGIGTTLITQRAAVLNKNVLEQIDVLIALRTVGPNDRKAIAGYVEANGTTEQQNELMNSIASLGLGEAWVWEPGADLFNRVQIRKRRTFNSSATPDASAPTQEIATLAKVDLEKISKEMAETITRAEQSDPAALRRRIAELERQTSREKEHPLVEYREVATIPDDVLVCIDMIVSDYETMGNHISLLSKSIKGALKHNFAAPEKIDTPVFKETQAKVKAGTISDAAAAATVAMDSGGPKLSAAGRKMLHVLAQFPAGRTRKQLSLLSGYSARSGHFSNTLGELRRLEYMSGQGDHLKITEAGFAAAGDVELAPTGRALIDFWMQRLSKAEAAMLEVILDAYPENVGYDHIAEQTGYSKTSGHFSNSIGRLRTMDLVTGYGGEVKAADIFFEGAAK